MATFGGGEGGDETGGSSPALHRRHLHAVSHPHRYRDHWIAGGAACFRGLKLVIVAGLSSEQRGKVHVKRSAAGFETGRTCASNIWGHSPPHTALFLCLYCQRRVVTMASSAAERSRAMRARRRLGLGPALKGRPCGALTSKQHAVALEAGRISKRRSRAAAAFRSSLAAPPAPAPVLAASTSPPAGTTISTPPPAATCPTTSVLPFTTCACRSPPPPSAATSIADPLFPSAAAACSPVAFTGLHASAADAFADVFGADYCSLRALLGHRRGRRGQAAWGAPPIAGGAPTTARRRAEAGQGGPLDGRLARSAARGGGAAAQAARHPPSLHSRPLPRGTQSPAYPPPPAHTPPLPRLPPPPSRRCWA